MSPEAFQTQGAREKGRNETIRYARIIYLEIANGTEQAKIGTVREDQIDRPTSYRQKTQEKLIKNGNGWFSL